jgi:hypothetical protein
MYGSSSFRFIKPAGEVVFYIDKDGCHVPDGISVDESAKAVIEALDEHIKNIVNPLKQQRDELLAALIEARSLLEESEQCYENQMFKNSQINAAIRKAKGE